ncbi:protein LYK5 [Macadamia integrifolia]|uniref:protein LYK5 n=1 Tax=Macadamia integrifolia TaxID=60698 RepID=UPI001C4EE046|nr:protein LYK5 [Macadamia integrifolia]
MERRLLSSSSFLLSNPFVFFFLFLFHSFHLLQAQQTYVNNKQLACYNYNNDSSVNGFLCNGPSKSCSSYLTFRSLYPYNTPIAIGYLLNADPSAIASINKVTEVTNIPTDTLVLIPVNCPCSGKFYQHNASYELKQKLETYFTVANNTYQALTTCQALMNQNPYDSRNLSVGLKLEVPLRCACPSRNQTANGVKFLLTYLIAEGDSVAEIGEMFGVDEQSINVANELTSGQTIYFFTPILVPLKTKPTIIKSTSPPPSPSQSPESPPVVPGSNSSNKKWVFVGIGIAAGLVLLALSGCLVWFLRRRRTRQAKPIPEDKKLGGSAYYSAVPEFRSGSVFSLGARNVTDSLTLYNFEELQKATEFFSEGHRIKGSVYRGKINGDDAAIKSMKGDVSNEINILKQINHSNVIRLSGFCVHQGSTYLVYEFAEKGSLSDWLHEKEYQSSCPLGWTQRVQIAYDMADGLNYLHNYTNPPYIHKDLKSSNILLDANFRAKITNFGLARTLEEENQEEGFQLTRHVVGTQGYLAPEYIENGVVTPKLDIFAFGVVMLELLSGREAATAADDDEKKAESSLSSTIQLVLEGENVREKLRGFMDPSLRNEYPLDLAFSMAQLAMNCVAYDLNSRPAIADVFLSLSKILSSSLDWDPSDNNLQNSGSFSHGR